MASDMISGLLNALDGYIGFMQVVECCLDACDCRNLFLALVRFRSNGCHDLNLLSPDSRPLYFLLAEALREKIPGEDPRRVDAHPGQGEREGEKAAAAGVPAAGADEYPAPAV